MKDQSRRAAAILIGAVIMIAILWGWPHVARFFAEDKCLDSGGQWEAESEFCLMEP